MKAILDLLRRPRATAADLRRALAELPPDTGAGTLTSLEGRRRAMLLDGSSDTAIEKVDREIAAARRERDRIAAACEELGKRLVEAEAAEALDALTAERDAAETEARAVADLFARRYGPLVDELLGLMHRLGAAEETATAANRRLEAAGFDDRVSPVETRIVAEPPLMYARRLAYAIETEHGNRR